MTTPTSRRRDVRASTAAAPAADEERSARFSPVLVKEREDGCRLLLLHYTSGEHPLPLLFSSHSDHAVSVSNTSRGYSRTPSLATPRGIQPRDPPPSPHPPASSLSRHRLALPFSQRRWRRSYETPPFTIAAATLPPGFNNPPRTPRALSSAPSRARYQLAAIPTAESRDRPRVVGEALRQSAIRLAATLRHAARCVCFSAPRFKSLRARKALSRAPRTVNHRRGAISRGFERVRPPQGAACLIVLILSPSR